MRFRWNICSNICVNFGDDVFVSTRKLALIYIFFALILVIANRLALGVCDLFPFDCPPYYPLSVFYPRIPEFSHILTALAVIGVFELAQRHLALTGYALPYVILWGITLVLGSNFFQGWERGFAVPIAGEPLRWTLDAGGHEYYHSALEVSAPIQFVRDFEALQPTLHLHSKTHPPGAVLTLWALRQLTPDPALIGILIACVSIILSACWLHRILRSEFQVAGYSVWLYLLIPAVQIYMAVSLDALISALFIGVLYGLGFARSRVGQTIGGVCLLLASWLTFGFVFLIPVMLVFARRGRLKLLMLSLLALVLVYVLLYALLGFNYLAAFQYASAHENPDGFRLFAQPVEYIFTRLENILEIALFFSPILCLLAAKGLRIQARLNDLAWVGIIVLTAMFMSGAFRTGETARACLFMYPYLLFPALSNSTGITQQTVARLVFGQTVLMQLLGVYFW